MKKVINTPAFIMNKLLLALKEQLPDIQTTRSTDPNDYETSLKALRRYKAKRNPSEDSRVSLPLFAFNRSYVSFYDSLFRRSVLKAFDSQTLFNAGVAIGTFDFNFMLYDSNIKSIEEFEVLYLSESVLSNLKVLTLDFLGEIDGVVPSFQITWSPCDQSFISVDDNLVYGIGASCTITGPYIVLDEDRASGLNYVDKLEFSILSSNNTLFFDGWYFYPEKYPAIKVQVVDMSILDEGDDYKPSDLSRFPNKYANITFMHGDTELKTVGADISVVENQPSYIAISPVEPPPDDCDHFSVSLVLEPGEASDPLHILVPRRPLLEISLSKKTFNESPSSEQSEGIYYFNTTLNPLLYKKDLSSVEVLLDGYFLPKSTLVLRENVDSSFSLGVDLSILHTILNNNNDFFVSYLVEEI